MTTTPEVRILKGEEVEQYLDDLALLRIQVFREWPYLYDGNLVYERRYMASYRNNPDAVLIAAFDQGKLVGASTGTPLMAHASEFATPLEGRGIDMERSFYCAESILLPDYRGQGLGHSFFDVREAHARELGMKASIFCAVTRPDDHPDRPDRYRPLDPFWKKRGYTPITGCVAHFSWCDLGADKESLKPLQIWHRGL
ncbi:MAG: GNAT family N-acetyltransferase [Pseudomonadota bacterium]